MIEYISKHNIKLGERYELILLGDMNAYFENLNSYAYWARNMLLEMYEWHDLFFLHYRWGVRQANILGNCLLIFYDRLRSVAK